MRVIYKDLMEKLGVGEELTPYETRPWFLYNAEKAVTCSAEVRIGPGAEDVDVEIQFLYDAENERSDDDDYTGPEQVFFMRFIPSRDQIWTETAMLVKGENYASKIHDWGARGCEFFCACIGALQMDELPDIDDLIKTLLTDSKTGGGGGRRGRVGKKGFKMEQKPPGMKV